MNARVDPDNAFPAFQCGEDISILGSSIHVPFVATRLFRPSLAWVNHRWFRSIGWDLSDPGAFAHVRSSILCEFAFAIPHSEDPSKAFASETAIFRADRYGSSQGEWHGGSGRCGSNGRMHTKGIGRTPLVSDRASVTHTSGMLLLWEAMLEAIGSELAHAELPGGSVPVIAIIDMGFESNSPHGRARRALMLRPDFIRPSHFERSIFFGSAGTSESDQFLDAKRVREAFLALPLARPQAATEGVGAFFREMFLANARQLGAANAQRLWLGTYASGNRSIDGCLVDFGAFRSVPDWRAHVTKHPEVFGSETTNLLITADALGFYLSKYLPGESLFETKALRNNLLETCERAFRNACGAALGVDSEHGSGRLACEVLRHCFDIQQTELAPVVDGMVEPTLSASQPPDPRCELRTHPLEQQAIEAVFDILKSSGESSQAVSHRICALKRWLHPRSAVFQQTLIEDLSRFERRVEWDSPLAIEDVSRKIDRTIAAARRSWQLGTSPFAIEGQWVSTASQGLVGTNADKERLIYVGGRLGEHLAATSDANAPDRCEGPNWQDIVRIDQISLQRLRSKAPSLANELKEALNGAYYYPKWLK